MRASKQWESLRQQRPPRFDQGLDRLEAQWPASAPTLAAGTERMWDLRPALTGSRTETMVTHTHQDEDTRQQRPCPQCNRLLTVRAPVPRTVETMVGPVPLARPSCSCRTCRCGVYPLDEVLGLTAGRPQLDVHKAAAQLVTEMPYDGAHPLCRDLTGLGLGRARRPTLTNQVAEGLTGLAVAPRRDEIARRIPAGAAGRGRRPVVGLGIDGASVPTRPESARVPQEGQRRTRAKRARGRGQGRDAKGLRLYRLAGDRSVPRLRWPQGQTEEQRGEALAQLKKAGGIPADHVRLCGVADGAEWIGTHVQALLPQARQVLDSYHGAQDIHKSATAPYGTSLQGLEWAEATMTRL